MSTKYELNINQYFAIHCLVTKSILVSLTYLSVDKMATNLAEDIYKCMFLNENDFTEICFLESSWQLVSIGSGNGMAPNRRMYVALWGN